MREYFDRYPWVQQPDLSYVWNAQAYNPEPYFVGRGLYEDPGRYYAAKQHPQPFEYKSMPEPTAAPQHPLYDKKKDMYAEVASPETRKKEPRLDPNYYLPQYKMSPSPYAFPLGAYYGSPYYNPNWNPYYAQYAQMYQP